MDTAKIFLIGILTIIVFSVTSVIILANLSGTVADDTATISTSEVILAESSQTLSQTPTSSSAQALNNSWLEFDGVNDEIVISNVQNFTKGNFSVGMWINMKQSLDNSRMIVCGAGVDAMILESDFLVSKFLLVNETPSTIGVSGMNLNLTEWIHLHGNYNGTHASLYINGINNGTTEIIDNNLRDINQCRLSRSMSVPSRYYSGGMDEVRLYNKSLDASEILEIYNSGMIANSSLPSDGLVLWYSFNENTGTTVYDKSGNGNNGE